MNGVCKSGRVALGGACDESFDCASGLLCRSSKCCKDVPLACSANSDCCSGICQNGTCCKGTNTACAVNGDCCSRICVNGTCASGPVPLGGTCDETADCEIGMSCQTGHCCRLTGGACDQSSDCCVGGCFDGTCVEAVAIIDVTAASECEIEYIEYTDETETVVLSTTGSQVCDGTNGFALYAYSPGSVGQVQAAGIDHVVLTGDDASDAAALDALLNTMLPPGGDGELGTVEASATNCVDGYYPSYHGARGSYKTYKWDGGPADTIVEFYVSYKRYSCTRYQINYVSQYLRWPSSQGRGLYWESYRYTRRLATTGPQTEMVCAKHVSSGTLSKITVYPVNYLMTPNGWYYTKSTNDRRDFCFSLGETWTGGVQLKGYAR